MLMNKLSELKVTIPADKKSRESVAAGYVTDNNSGGYFVIECQECGAVYPSQQADGGGQIADTGDYNDAICPHCGEEGPEECDNVGLAWNVQQAKIIALLAELEASSLQCRGIEQERELFRLESTAHQLHAQALEQRIAELERANQSQDDHINQQQDRIDSLEKTNASLGRGLAAAEKRLATPVRLPELTGDEDLAECVFKYVAAIRAAGFKCVGGEQ